MNRSNLSISNSEIAEATRFFRRMVVFALPFVLAGAFILIVDPFEYFRVVKLIPTETKYSIAKQIDPCFWRLNRFESAPTENVLLGDSRMEAINPDVIKRVSGETYTNLAYGGGTLREAFDSFWIAARRINLKHVYLGVALTSYNDYEISNRVQFYSSVRGNLALYLVNRGVWESSLYDVESAISGKEIKLGVPQMNKDEFWQVELGILQKYYDKYVEPKKYRKELRDISEYCLANGIELNFIIFPMHVDAQRQLVDSKMLENSEKMRRDLSKFGRIFDFEVDNDINRDKANFNDPVHTNQFMQEMLINEIWGRMENQMSKDRTNY
jgi:hypothetical protein